MRITRTGIATGALATVLAVGAGVPAVLAQEDGTGGAAEETTTDITTQRDEWRAERDAAFAEALAAELDLDTDTVADAIDTVRSQLHEERRQARQEALAERLDAAVEDGDLTREQADALLEAADAGVLGGRGPGGPGHGAGRHLHHGFGPDGPPAADGAEATAGLSALGRA